MKYILIALELNIFQKYLKNSQEKNIITNIYRIPTFDSIMYGYFSIGLFLFKGKSSLDYKNLFSPNDYEKNYIIILKHFQ